MAISLLSYLRLLIPAKGSFSANVLTLMTGTTICQILIIVASPILTRLYSPADYGIYALFISITGILAVVVNWNYEPAILLPQDDHQSADLVVLCTIIALGMSGVSFIAVLFFRHQIATLMKTPELAPWLWYVSLSIFLSGLFKALTNWSTRKKRFQEQSVANVSESVVRLGTQITSGIVFPGSGPLILGQLFGQIVGVGVLIKKIWNDHKNIIFRRVSTKDLWHQATVYKKFPLLGSWAGLANTLAHQIPIWFIAFLYGAHIVGFYALANRTINLPASFISDSFSRVFFERAAVEKRDSGSSIKIFKKVFITLSAISILPFIFIWTFGAKIFSLVFGSFWDTAGTIAAIMAPLSWIRFVVAPLSLVTFVHEKQEFLLCWQLGLALISAGSLYISSRYFSDISTVLTIFSISLCCWYLILLILLSKISLGKNRM